MSRSHVPKLVSLLYFHNPFYLISACLFVYGLKLLYRVGDTSVLFQPGTVAYIEPWGMLASLAAVTVLMATTVILIVRFGRVWEDARSLVLIVLLMLLAISVSMDELINVLSDKDNSIQHLLLMFGLGASFAILIGEFLVRGLPIKLNPGYRLPLYGFLALFFLWPAGLLREMTGLTALSTRWLIVAFPLLCGLLTLTLIPAVRRGSAAVSDNGTPWKWPLVPWTPVVFIALAVCFRSYSLTMSFDTLQSSGHYWDTAFGVDQLVPFLLAIFVVLLEITIVENLPVLQRRLLLTTFIGPVAFRYRNAGAAGSRGGRVLSSLPSARDQARDSGSRELCCGGIYQHPEVRTVTPYSHDPANAATADVAWPCDYPSATLT